jgi:hypothetical protein
MILENHLFQSLGGKTYTGVSRILQIDKLVALCVAAPLRYA